MESAIENFDWYEVGECLKESIFTNNYCYDLSKLHAHFYNIDSEILATYFAFASISA